MDKLLSKIGGVTIERRNKKNTQGTQSAKPLNLEGIPTFPPGVTIQKISDPSKPVVPKGITVAPRIGGNTASLKPNSFFQGKPQTISKPASSEFYNESGYDEEDYNFVHSFLNDAKNKQTEEGSNIARGKSHVSHPALKGKSGNIIPTIPKGITIQSTKKSTISQPEPLIKSEPQWNDDEEYDEDVGDEEANFDAMNSGDYGANEHYRFSGVNSKGTAERASEENEWDENEDYENEEAKDSSYSFLGQAFEQQWMSETGSNNAPSTTKTSDILSNFQIPKGLTIQPPKSNFSVRQSSDSNYQSKGIHGEGTENKKLNLDAQKLQNYHQLDKAMNIAGNKSLVSSEDEIFDGHQEDEYESSYDEDKYESSFEEVEESVDPPTTKEILSSKVSCDRINPSQNLEKQITPTKLSHFQIPPGIVIEKKFNPSSPQSPRPKPSLTPTPPATAMKMATTSQGMSSPTPVQPIASPMKPVQRHTPSKPLNDPPVMEQRKHVATSLIDVVNSMTPAGSSQPHNMKLSDATALLQNLMMKTPSHPVKLQEPPEQSLNLPPGITLHSKKGVNNPIVDDPHTEVIKNKATSTPNFKSLPPGISIQSKKPTPSPTFCNEDKNETISCTSSQPQISKSFFVPPGITLEKKKLEITPSEQIPPISNKVPHNLVLPPGISLEKKKIPFEKEVNPASRDKSDELEPDESFLDDEFEDEDEDEGEIDKSTENELLQEDGDEKDKFTDNLICEDELIDSLDNVDEYSDEPRDFSLRTVNKREAMHLSKDDHENDKLKDSKETFEEDEDEGDDGLEEAEDDVIMPKEEPLDFETMISSSVIQANESDLPNADDILKGNVEGDLYDKDLMKNLVEMAAKGELEGEVEDDKDEDEKTQKRKSSDEIGEEILPKKRKKKTKTGPLDEKEDGDEDDEDDEEDEDDEDGDEKGGNIDKSKVSGTHLRKNIREVMDESKLDEATLAAQRQEAERLKRIQDQQRIIREVQRQIQINKASEKNHSRVLSLLQGNTQTSILKTSVIQPQTSSTAKLPNNVLLKMGNGQQTNLNDKMREFLKSSGKPAPEESSARNLLGNVSSSVTIAPIKKEPMEEKKKKKGDVVTLSSDSEDDCIVLSEEEMESEPDEDPTNSGMHTNDRYNVPDEQGRVLVNTTHPPEEPDIFLAPQIARIIKPHQVGGIRFLYDNIIENLKQYNSSAGFGCILAHSMGLGKTLQIVSFSDIYLRHTSGRKILCIMPINTIQNWLAEFNMWVPKENHAGGDIRCRNYDIYVVNESLKNIHSRGRVILEWHKNGGVLLMGYELFRLLSLKKPIKSKRKRPDEMEEERNRELVEDIYQALVKPGPDLVICDEGHRIKNSHATTSQALKQIRTRRRVVLTGYPLQNNLLEYWCMVDFVRPNYLGSKAEFSNMFERPIQNGQCIDSTPQDKRLMRYRAHVLHSLLEGFVQRRSHAVLQQVLPKKDEYVLLFRFTSFQKKLYDTFMNEVVRTVTVPNPLKAFAVCCKIWNHPDVLYNFLKKKGEQIDLDLEETLPPIGLSPLIPSHPESAPPGVINIPPPLPWPRKGPGSRGGKVRQPSRKKLMLQSSQSAANLPTSQTDKPESTQLPSMSQFQVQSTGYGSQNLQESLTYQPGNYFPKPQQSQQTQQPHRNEPHQQMPYQQSSQQQQHSDQSQNPFHQQPHAGDQHGQLQYPQSQHHQNEPLPNLFQQQQSQQQMPNDQGTNAFTQMQQSHPTDQSLQQQQQSQQTGYNVNNFNSSQKIFKTEAGDMFENQQQMFGNSDFPSTFGSDMGTSYYPDQQQFQQQNIGTNSQYNDGNLQRQFFPRNDGSSNSSFDYNQSTSDFTQPSGFNDSGFGNSNYGGTTGNPPPDYQQQRQQQSQQYWDNNWPSCNSGNYSGGSSGDEFMSPPKYPVLEGEKKMENFSDSFTGTMATSKLEKDGPDSKKFAMNPPATPTKTEQEEKKEELKLENPKKDDIPYDWAIELFKNYVTGVIANSSKMEAFFLILNESIARQDRILVFSQSLLTLDLIEEYLQRHKVPGQDHNWAKNRSYFRLDGSTQALEREKLINEFNASPNVFLFLVSTRAGSLGINLVGANRVIVFDASWNPCHDTQAVCRVYRYGQKKPCFVYRFVMDCCLEKKIYDRQINKQGMADRVVDELNPDAHLSIKEVTNLCWDDQEETSVEDYSNLKDKYNDDIIKILIQDHSPLLSRAPFQHESLLIDRKEKKLSQAEKRLAKRSYELEKQAANQPRNLYQFLPSPGSGLRSFQKPIASVKPMQMDRFSVPTRSKWIPVEVWQKQGMSAQEMTLPLDVVIPTNSPEKTSIVLKAGERVMVLKSPKGIFMQLQTGKMIAIRTAFKVGGQQTAEKADDSKANQIASALKNNPNVTVTHKTRNKPAILRHSSLDKKAAAVNMAATKGRISITNKGRFPPQQVLPPIIKRNDTSKKTDEESLETNRTSSESSELLKNLRDDVLKDLTMESDKLSQKDSRLQMIRPVPSATITAPPLGSDMIPQTVSDLQSSTGQVTGSTSQPETVLSNTDDMWKQQSAPKNVALTSTEEQTVDKTSTSTNSSYAYNTNVEEGGKEKVEQKKDEDSSRGWPGYPMDPYGNFYPGYYGYGHMPGYDGYPYHHNYPPHIPPAKQENKADGTPVTQPLHPYPPHGYHPGKSESGEPITVGPGPVPPPHPYPPYPPRAYPHPSALHPGISPIKQENVDGSHVTPPPAPLYPPYPAPYPHYPYNYPPYPHQSQPPAASPASVTKQPDSTETPPFNAHPPYGPRPPYPSAPAPGYYPNYPPYRPYHDPNFPYPNYNPYMPPAYGYPPAGPPPQHQMHHPLPGPDSSLTTSAPPPTTSEGNPT